MTIEQSRRQESKRPPQRAGAATVASMAITQPENSLARGPRLVKRENQALSSLIDQAVAREERAARLAAHYTAEAAKHRAVRSQLERLIP